jgi:hypothetical protein
MEIMRKKLKPKRRVKGIPDGTVQTVISRFLTTFPNLNLTNKQKPEAQKVGGPGEGGNEEFLRVFEEITRKRKPSGEALNILKTTEDNQKKQKTSGRNLLQDL